MRRKQTRNLSHQICCRIALALPACLLLMHQYALAAPVDFGRLGRPGDTLTLSAGTTYMFDSNVFRLSPLIDPVAFLGTPTKSDQIITTTATLNLNKTFSMQRFELTGSLVDNRYLNFSFLDFLGKNYTAAWNWYLTPYLHGRLSSSHSEALNNFGNLTGFINSTNRNLRTTDNFRFDGVFELSRAWHIVGGINHNVIKNSRLTVQDFDNKISSVEGGIRYAFAKGSTLTYKVRAGEGEFVKRPQPIASALFDTRFNELEHEVRLVWPVTAKSSIEGRAGYLQREHAHFPQRDFNGFVGNFNLNWAITEKTRLMASWSHDLINFQTAADFQLNPLLFQRWSSSYAVTDRFTVAPSWQITAKTQLRLRYDYVMRDFRGGVSLLPFEPRSDSQHSAHIALDWQPMNVLLITGMLQKDRRSSSLRGFDYDSNAASLAVRFTF